jgi:hypothetical protein
MDQARSIRILLNQSASREQRVRTARNLAEYGSDAGLTALREVAEDEATPTVVARAVGEAIAQILLRTNRVNEIHLANFSGPAYFSFDEAVTRAQK